MTQLELVANMTTQEMGKLRLTEVLEKQVKLIFAVVLEIQTWVVPPHDTTHDENKLLKFCSEPKTHQEIYDNT